VIRSSLEARIIILESRAMRRARPTLFFSSNGFCTASCTYECVSGIDDSWRPLHSPPLQR